MRICCAGQTTFQYSDRFPRRNLPQCTHAQHKSTENVHARRSLARKTLLAALSTTETLSLTDRPCPTASTEAAFALLERAVSVSDAERPSSAPTSKRETLESPEELASTSGQRAIVGLSIFLLGAIGSQGVAGIHSSAQAVGVSAAVFVAYILAGLLRTLHSFCAAVLLLYPECTRHCHIKGCSGQRLLFVCILQATARPGVKFMRHLCNCRFWHWCVPLVC